MKEGPTFVGIETCNQCRHLDMTNTWGNVRSCSKSKSFLTVFVEHDAFYITPVCCPVLRRKSALKGWETRGKTNV